MNDYDKVKRIVEAHCKMALIPLPRITESLPDDPCDFTDDKSIRINVKAAGDISPYYHAAHVLGHYLCCVHAVADETEWDPRADMVADIIAVLLVRSGPLWRVAPWVGALEEKLRANLPQPTGEEHDE